MHKVITLVFQGDKLKVTARHIDPNKGVSVAVAIWMARVLNKDNPDRVLRAYNGRGRLIYEHDFSK